MYNSIINFFNQSLWLDEATTALVARMPVKDIFENFLPGDFHPPFYYVFMHFWVKLFGTGEISLRLPSYVFALLAIYVVYKIAGKWAALLLSTSGLFIYYSGEARMYMLVVFLVSSLVYSFINNKWVLFSLLLVLIGMTDYVALFILPAILILDSGGSRKKVLAYSIPLVVAYGLWSPIFLKQLKYGFSVSLSSWGSLLGGVNFKNIFLIPTKFIFGRISIDDKGLYGVIAILTISFIGYLLIKVRTSPIFWGWLLTPIVLGVLVSFKVPILTYFRYLFCLPALYILISKTDAKKYLLYVVLAINLVTTSYYVFNPRFYREDWRSAAIKIGNEKIVFPAGSQHEAIVYYGKEKQIINVNNITKGDKTIWLSRYVWQLFDPNDSTRIKIESLGYNKTSEYNFNGVVFYKYENRN